MLKSILQETQGTVLCVTASAGAMQASAKIGTAIGTGIAPGVGTVVGLIAGVAVGGLVDLFFNKVTDKYIYDMVENN